MKPIVVLFFIVLLLSSCGKKATIHITAKNAVTGVPYSGLTYYLVRSTSGGSGEKTKTIATGTLNENGEIVLTERLSRSSTYAVRVEPPGNTCYNKQITFYLGTEDKFECPFEFAECAYLKLNINNVNCQGPSDSMHFRSKQSYTEWQSFSSYRVGCYNYLSPDFFQVPAGWRIYNWVVDRNGVVTNFKDSIFLQPGTNGTITMNY
ncbi:MAG: hypothetical protein IT221_08310 [Fluviicola sp.]|nr:hypothetical protein [Fluviicola sp.]